MNQTSDASNASPPLSPAARVLWAVLILTTLYFCYFHNLGALGLIGPDEPRYAWIARDMAETGDWVTPRLYGKPWFEKPPLYYWGAALSFKIFGVSEAAARLPSAVCALLATLAMAWLAWRVYGAETSRWVLLLLPTTVGMIGFSHAAATDMPFAAMLTVAMVFAAGILGLVSPAGFSIHTPVSSFYTNTRPAGIVSLFFFGFFLGLATLAKGPAALILAGGGVLLWAVFTKRWRDAFRCLHPVAIASFSLTALPWYILCARRNPEFFRVFIIEHNFNRFLTPEFQHIQPFWFYVPILLTAIFPWTILLLCLGISYSLELLHTFRLGDTTVFLLCWAGFPLAFFSASQSKLPGYILPAVPTLGFCLACGITSMRPAFQRAAMTSFYLTSIGAAAATLTLTLKSVRTLSKLEPFQPILVFSLLALGLMILLLAISVAVRTRSLLALSFRFAAFSIFLFILFVASQKEILNGLGIDSISARGLSITLLRYGATPQNLHLVRVKRAAQYQLDFYFHENLRGWDGDAKVGDLLLGESISCTRLGLTTGCEDLWGRLDQPGDWALLRISSAPQ